MNWVRKYLIRLVDNSPHFDWEKIEIKEGSLGLFNRNCHWNSYRYFVKNPKRYSVVECKCVNKKDNNTVLHYIIYDKFTKEYKDKTLGDYGRIHYDYFKTKEFDSFEHGRNQDMDKILDIRKRYVVRKCIYNGVQNKLWRKFLLWYVKNNEIDGIV